MANSLSMYPNPQPMNNITVRHISKAFGEVQALSDISLEVKPGELFGLVGPDGAGKTTLFRILVTLLLADSGEAEVAGYDVVRDYRRIRSSVGYMPGRFSLYQDMTVEENLNFFATLFGTTVKENYELIRDIYVQIAPFRDRKAGKLSGGMKQKLALCCALVHRPEVLFLDEPTTGVDPVSRVEFWDMLYRLKAEGITIMVSTPYMDEAERCDRIALMREGRCRKVDTVAGICAGYGQPLYEVRGPSLYRLLLDLRTFGATAGCFSFGDTLHLALRREEVEQSGEEVVLDRLKAFMAGKGYPAVTVQSIAPTVEDCFMALQ